MKEEKQPFFKRILQNVNAKDALGFIAFLFIPLTFFVSNFVANYRIYYFAILAVSIMAYTFVGQFFFEEEKLSSLGKRLIAITIINTIILSFVYLTGNLMSPYFFIFYFLIFSVAILFPVWILIIECLIIFISIFTIELYKFPSITVMFRSIDVYYHILFLSLIVAIPVTAAISKFVKDLQEKDKLLRVSMDLLQMEDIEDEALLSEINQGVIIIDPKMRIIKVSRWIEKNFSVNAQVLLGKSITELELYDAVSNRRILPHDFFYKNLMSPMPKVFNWRVLYKDQYGKYKKFVIRQTPLIVEGSIKGVLLSINNPPTSVQEIVNTFNQLLIFRLSSSIGMIKNLIVSSDLIRTDPSYPVISKHLALVTGILTDTNTKNNILEGTFEVRMTEFDIKPVLSNVINILGKVGKINVWSLSPIYQTKPVLVKADKRLTEQLLTYVILASIYLSRKLEISLSIDQDEVTKRPRIAITADPKVECKDDSPLTEPFFGGQISLLARYSGTGLELSNASLIAKFLDFDFRAGISNNKLVATITF